MRWTWQLQTHGLSTKWYVISSFTKKGVLQLAETLTKVEKLREARLWMNTLPLATERRQQEHRPLLEVSSCWCMMTRRNQIGAKTQTVGILGQMKSTFVPYSEKKLF